jgi:hypothetical protein
LARLFLEFPEGHTAQITRWTAPHTRRSLRLRVHLFADHLFGLVLRAADSGEAVLPYSFSGTQGLVQGASMDRRFFHRLGSAYRHRIRDFPLRYQGPNELQAGCH